MLFKYSLNIDVESTFESPLLGSDLTFNKRKKVDEFVKDSVKEFIDNGKHTGPFEKTLDEDGIKITIKCGKHLGNANIQR
jgi:hypothetical protein